MNGSSRSERADGVSSSDIETILEQHRWVVDSLANKYANGDEALQEDLQQEGLLALSLLVDEFEPGVQAFSSAAFARVRDRMKNYLRNAQDPSDTDLRLSNTAADDDAEGAISNPFALEEVLADASPSPEDELFVKERNALIREIVEKLPEAERVLIQMVVFDAVPQNKAAETLNIPMSTLNEKLSKAVDKVRRRLEKAL